jgi:hypothetical protein
MEWWESIATGAALIATLLATQGLHPRARVVLFCIVLLIAASLIARGVLQKFAAPAAYSYLGLECEYGSVPLKAPLTYWYALSGNGSEFVESSQPFLPTPRTRQSYLNCVLSNGGSLPVSYIALHFGYATRDSRKNPPVLRFSASELSMTTINVPSIDANTKLTFQVQNRLHHRTLMLLPTETATCVVPPELIIRPCPIRPTDLLVTTPLFSDDSVATKRP